MATGVRQNRTPRPPAAPPSSRIAAANNRSAILRRCCVSAICGLPLVRDWTKRQVARETQYFGDPFEPGPSRAQWVERMR